MNLTDAMNYFYYRMAMYELQVLNKKDYYDGLSYHTILYLNIISQLKDCTVSKIADALKITRSAATLKINELVRQGTIVKTQSDQDKRVYYIRLSPNMEQTMHMYNQVFMRIEQDLHKQYTDEQLELFLEILCKISEHGWEES